MATEEVRKLSDLLDISQTLGSTLNPRAALTRVLEILEDRHGVVSGSVALLAEGGAELAIEASTGLSGEVARRTRYKVGERKAGGGAAGQPGAPLPRPHRGRPQVALGDDLHLRAGRRQRPDGGGAGR